VAKLVPLLREGADDVERMLLASARQDGPPDTAARDRTLEAAKAASRTAAVAGAGAALGRWLAALKISTSVSLAVGGVGVAVALGGAALVSGRGSIVARHVSSTAEGPAHPLAAPPSLPTQGPSPAEAPRAGVPARRQERDDSPRRVEPAKTPRLHPSTPRAHSGVSHDHGPNVVPTEGMDVPAEARAASVAPEARAPEATSVTSAPSTSAVSSSTAPAPPEASLRREAALLEAVRESLAGSQLDRALVLLDDYDARFATGVLSEESAVLRIEALVAAGRRAAADAKLTEFARRYPASSYGPRLRALAGKE
jgi:hypothetical protein